MQFSLVMAMVQLGERGRHGFNYILHTGRCQPLYHHHVQLIHFIYLWYELWWIDHGQIWHWENGRYRIKFEPRDSRWDNRAALWRTKRRQKSPCAKKVSCGKGEQGHCHYSRSSSKMMMYHIICSACCSAICVASWCGKQKIFIRQIGRAIDLSRQGIESNNQAVHIQRQVYLTQSGIRALLAVRQGFTTLNKV